MEIIEQSPLNPSTVRDRLLQGHTENPLTAPLRKFPPKPAKAKRPIVHSKHCFEKPPEERNYRRAPAKRDAKIYTLREQGLGIAEIGRRMNLSPQRVSQILKRKAAK